MSKLILDCTKTSEKTWQELYNVPRHEKLPTFDYPEWHYEHSRCTHCGCDLMFCKNNPRGFDSEYTRERRVARKLALEQRLNPPEPEVVVDPAAEPIVSLYRQGCTVREIREKLSLHHAKVTQILAENGITVRRGRRPKQR